MQALDDKRRVGRMIRLGEAELAVAWCFAVANIGKWMDNERIRAACFTPHGEVTYADDW